ncbi:phosphoglycerate kinase, partial [Chloroflexota bacterium]
INTVPVENIPPDLRIADIGPQTIIEFGGELRKCKTIFWNGPMGIYEIPQFAEGTKQIARLLADLDADTIIGGGSTTEAVNELGIADRMTFVSTGGGASLKLLSGNVLPGVEVLLKKT